MKCSASMIRLRTSVAALRGRSVRQASTIRRHARVRAATPAVCFLDEKASTVVVSFSLTRKVPFGQQLVLVGDAPQLGAWDVGAAPLLSWSEGDVWHCSVELPAGAAVQYKFVQQIPHRPPVWESCMNRTQTISPELAELTCVWGAPLATSWPALRGEAAAAAAGGREDGGREESDLTEDDAPAPAFQPAATLSQIAEAVKKSAAAAAERLQPAEKEPAAERSSAAAATPVAAAAVPAAAVSAPAAAPTQPVTAAAEPKAVAPVPAVASAAAKEPAGAAVASVQAVKAVPAKPAAPKAANGAAPAAAQAAGTAGKPVNGGGTTLKSFGKAAGTVAMGVAATAMLSALAIDVTDAALLGAVAMGSFAAMSTPSPSSSKGSKNGGGRSVRAAAGGDAAEGAAAEEAAEGEVPRAATTIGNKASAPGVILAASVLSALDAGKKLLEKEAEAGPGSDAE